MYLKKIIFLFSLLLLLSCGYKPIHSSKESSTKYNFSIKTISFLGNNKINQLVKNSLNNYLKLKEKSKSFDLIINSKINKEITTKNAQGNAEKYSIEISLDLKVLENEIIVGEKNFIKKFEYNNQSNKFNLNLYEKNLEKSLISKISEEMIFYVYNLK